MKGDTAVTGITGVGNTGCLVDWLRCVFPPGNGSLERAKELFGQGRSWRRVGRGKMGYGERLMRGHISIYHDGIGDTVCADISGQGCRQLEAEKNFTSGQDWQKFFAELVRARCQFPRVDWAFDDFANKLDVAAIIENVESGHCTTRLRKFKHTTILRASDGQTMGLSAAFGSRTSEFSVRIYDKLLERAAKRRPSERTQWVRMEIETKNKQALALVKVFITEGPVAIQRDLHARLNFRMPPAEKQDSNKSRWPSAPWWSSFLNDCEKSMVTVAPTVITLDDIAQNIEIQWAPNLALLMVSPRFGNDWLQKVLARGERRWDERHWDLLERP